VIWLAFALQGPTTGHGALDPPGAGAPLRPALGGRPPRRRRPLPPTPAYLLVKAPCSSL
jgi:hypothetical protein